MTFNFAPPYSARQTYSVLDCAKNSYSRTKLYDVTVPNFKKVALGYPLRGGTNLAPPSLPPSLPLSVICGFNFRERRRRRRRVQFRGKRLLRSLEGCKQCCQMAKFDPFLSLDCARVEGVGAQSKERKGSNFAA